MNAFATAALTSWKTSLFGIASGIGVLLMMGMKPEAIFTALALALKGLASQDHGVDSTPATK